MALEYITGAMTSQWQSIKLSHIREISAERVHGKQGEREREREKSYKIIIIIHNIDLALSLTRRAWTGGVWLQKNLHFFHWSSLENIYTRCTSSCSFWRIFIIVTTKRGRLPCLSNTILISKRWKILKAMIDGLGKGRLEWDVELKTWSYFSFKPFWSCIVLVGFSLLAFSCNWHHFWKLCTVHKNKRVRGLGF